MNLSIESAVKIVNGLINDKLKESGPDSFLTDDLIQSMIDEILKMSMYDGIDNYELFDIVSQQNSTFFEEDSKMLLNNQNHEEWLDPLNNKGYHRDIEWNFWNDYEKFLLEDQKFSQNIINGPRGISRTINKILSALDDPKRDGPWDRRGLVVGEVQSGKTANFIGLICKAADSGYKLIIVLAGLYNDLRAQTQQRIDEGFIGYNSKNDLKEHNENHRIGVGNYYGHLPVIYYTNGSNNGDFNKSDADQTPAPLDYHEPIILVVKKNKSMMDNINNWISRYMHKNKTKISDVPLMVIDDECDNASVNTKKFRVDDDEHVPTAINYGIRDILNKFDKSVYIGYTATPFANILIKRDDEHKSLGNDLFPRDFILNIPRPSNHIGPEQFFGITGDKDLHIESSDGYPLLYRVRDGDMLLPNIKQLKTAVVVPEGLNLSLKRAIKSFILSCAARLFRGQDKSHNSMLIHVTHYVNAQEQIFNHVDAELERLRNIINNADSYHILWQELKSIWNDEYVITSKFFSEDKRFKTKVHTWNDIKPHIKTAVERMIVNQVNGNSNDALEYNKLKEANIFKNIIAVGGNRLARGLTLESLTMSYFLRTSKMYDTLLQMGRWFGYRDNYLDLCRIYTTTKIITAYRHISLATKELKDEFDHMYNAKEKPENWGLKIRSHPGLLLVTGYGKSHWSTKASITFDAKLLQSHNTQINETDCVHNLDVINKAFVSKYKFEKTKNKVAYINNNISPEDIKHFINNYKIGPAHAWRPALISSYLENRNSKNELTSWTVGILNAQRTKNAKEYKDLKIPDSDTIRHLQGVGDIKLTLRNGQISSSGNYIELDKAVLSGSHEKLDFPIAVGEGKENYPESTPPEIREKRSLGRGLLLLYPLFGKISSDIALKENEKPDLYGLDDHLVFGAVISFSGSSGKENRVDYVFNDVYTQLELFK